MTTLTTTADGTGAWALPWPSGLTAGTQYQMSITQTVGGLTSPPALVTKALTAEEVAAVDGAWAQTAAYGLSGAAQQARVASILPAYAVTPPLASISGAALAIGLRRLTTSYWGPIVSVRRSSDNTVQDIWWGADGWLDTAALLTFCGAGSGYVTKWWDQSGNGRHVVQAATATQPRIVNAGVVETAPNGKPWLVFSGAQALKSITTLPSFGDTDSSLVCLFKSTSASPQRAICHGDTAAPRSLGVGGTGTQARLWAGNILLGSVASLASVAGTYGSGTATLYIGGSSGSASQTYATGAEYLSVGEDTYYHGYLTGNIAEAIMYSRKLSAAEIASIRAEHITSWGAA